MERARRVALQAGVSIAAILSLTPVVALAQQSRGGAADAAAKVEELVVYAQKRAESSQNVPIAITAFSGENMATMGIQNTQDLANFTPGLNITRGNIANVPFIRGVGLFTATPGVEFAVATFIDGVYQPSPAGSTYNFNNIASVEVDKGPQGTLFGRNAAAGVIAIWTKDPSHTPLLDVSAGYGNYNTVSASFYGSRGFGDKVAGDLAIQYSHQGEGWGTNLFTGKDAYLAHDFSARSKWVFTPNDDWKFTLIGYYSRTRNDQATTQAILPGTTSLNGQVHVGGYYDVNFGPLSGLAEAKQYGSSVTISGNLGWAEFKSITSGAATSAVIEGVDDACACKPGQQPINQGLNVPREATYTQEFQLSSPASSKIRWVGGVYLLSDIAQRNPKIEILTKFASLPGGYDILNSKMDTKSVAVFGQTTVPITDDTRITAGYRWTRDERTIQGQFTDRNGVILQTVLPKSASWEKPTYRLALDHNFTPDILGYVSVGRGFNSGTFSTSKPQNNPVNPQVLDAYEIGVKSELLDHTLRINVTLFDEKFSNLQVQIAGATGAVLLNAGEATFKGIDLDVAATPTKNLTLVLAMEAVDPVYSDFKSAVFNFPCTSRAINSACATSVNGGGYFTGAGDATGNDVTFAEKFTISGNVQYRIPTESGDFLLSGTAAYHDGFYFDVQNTLKQPNYLMLNASAKWTRADGKLDVKLWGQNLGGAKYAAQSQILGPVITYSAAQPLTYGVTVGYHFK